MNIFIVTTCLEMFLLNTSEGVHLRLAITVHFISCRILLIVNMTSNKHTYCVQTTKTLYIDFFKLFMIVINGYQIKFNIFVLYTKHYTLFSYLSTHCRIHLLILLVTCNRLFCFCITHSLGFMIPIKKVFITRVKNSR